MKQKPLFPSVLLIIVSVLLFCGMFLHFVQVLRDNLRYDTGITLRETARQGVNTLRAVTEGHLRTLRFIAARLTDMALNDPEATIKQLQAILKLREDKRLGFVLADGRVFTTDGETMPAAAGLWRASLEGQEQISDPLRDCPDGKPVNLYIVPMFKDGNPVGALFSVMPHDDFSRHLVMTFWQDEGFSFLIKKDGSVIVPSRRVEAAGIVNYIATLAALPQAGHTLAARVQQALDSGSTAFLQYYSLSGNRYAYLMPVGINDWSLVSVLPAYMTEDHLRSVMLGTGMLGAVQILCILAFIWHINRVQYNASTRLWQQVYVDTLTEGCSYTRFLMKASEQLSELPGRWALMSLDIDNFKLVNSILDQETGNATLLKLYRLLRAWAGRPHELVARHTGDVFVALLPLTGERQLEQRLDELCNQILHTRVDENDSYRLVPSIGICLLPENPLQDSSLETWLDKSTLARRTVKGNHEQLYAFFDESMESIIRYRKSIENDMVSALAREEFEIFYQSKNAASDGRLVGAEALVRWQRNGVQVPPGDFIAEFERNGFIVNLDRYVFLHVCRQIREWRKAGLEPVPVSVNISRLHLYDPGFVERYIRMLDVAEKDRKLLQLEITESVLLENASLIKDTVSRLRAQGVTILIDDFGTGYSAMSMLKEIKVDGVKLDKSFLVGIGSPRTDTLLRSTISMCRSLDMEVTVEGVETAHEVAFLRSLGCDTIQGYYFSRPSPAAVFTAMLQEAQPHD